MKNKNLATFAAVAALLGAAASVHAAGLTVNSGDIILGFQDSANSIEFDIGAVTALPTAPVTDLGINVNTALSFTYSGTANATKGAKGYGATWATGGTVSWAAVAAPAGGNSWYMGLSEGATPQDISAGVTAPSSTFISIGSASTPSNNLATVTGAMGTIPPAGQLKAGGSTILAASYVNSSSSSFSHWDPNSAASAFGNITPSAGINTNTTNVTTGTSGILNGVKYSALDLYSYTNSGANVVSQFIGVLALSQTGELYFAAAPVPEPSTYAAIMGVATLGIALIRRRRQAAAAL